MFACKTSQSHESESEADKQMAAIALDHGRPTDDGQSISSSGQSDYNEGRKLTLILDSTYLTSSKVAEALYTKGFISYPRTETDQFDKGIDLKKLVEKQYPDNSWGQYAREYAHWACVSYTRLIPI